MHAHRRRSRGSRAPLAALLGAALSLAAPAAPASPARAAVAAVAVPATQGPLEVEAALREASGLAARATVGLQVGANLGSGVIVSPDGHVLTAGHVAEAPGRRARVTLSDGREVEGVTLGVNRWIDSGMVLITERGDWPYLEMGSAADLAPGDWVIALGHPGGARRGRPPVVRAGRVGSLDARVVRTDCTIASGDSGGPLVDLRARVVGIHTSLRPVLVGNDHLPVDTFRRTWEMLASGESWGGGSAGRARLGIDATTGERGCTVRRLPEGGAAERAGLRVGDVILELRGAPVEDAAALEQLVSEQRAGEPIPVVVARGGERLEVTVSPDRHDGRDPVRIVSMPWRELGRSKLERGVLEAFRGCVAAAAASTVEVLAQGRRVALGAVVRPTAVVTKASELDGPVSVRAGDRRLDAVVAAVDETWDLALLTLSEPLSPLAFADVALSPGQWVVTPDGRSAPASVGVVGAPAAPVPPRPGYLGVLLEDAAGRTRVTQVLEDTPAAAAGLAVDDELLEVAGAPVASRHEATRRVRDHRPGSRVGLALARGGERLEVEAVLAPHPVEEDEPLAVQDRQAGPLSGVRSGFPSAVLHDSVLRPEECGGPLLDSAGRAVGLNLARAGRTASYAVPSRELEAVVAELLRRAQ